MGASVRRDFSVASPGVCDGCRAIRERVHQRALCAISHVGRNVAVKRWRDDKIARDLILDTVRY